ncbi:MAG TPA: hypothetical protein PKD45_14930 [Flavobacteriales bacterium]|nr:hypothetical protein [Flavobacteriales bacterium]
MDTASLKLSLVERLLLVWDTKALQRIGEAIEKEMEAGEDFTEEELAELEKQRADHLSGKSRSYTAEESLRMIRNGSDMHRTRE